MNKAIPLVAFIILVGIGVVVVACTPRVTDPTIRGCLELARPALRDTCLSGVGILRTDTKLCDMTSDAMSRAYCYEKIAEASNNSLGCDGVNTTYWKDICYSHFGKQDNNEQFCLKVHDDTGRDDCFYDVGTETLNNRWCQQIRDYGSRIECFSTVGKQLNNQSVCNILGGSEQAICEYNIAVAKMNLSWCNTISFPKIKAVCETRIHEKLNNTPSKVTTIKVPVKITPV